MATDLDPKVIDWLLDTDPALRWQVERDILGAPENVWQATRARVPREGFGRAVLDKQDADGRWAGGAHFPSDFSEEEFHEKGQPWTATSWSLNLLRDWGVDAASMGQTAQLLEQNCHWEYDDLPYWQGEVDACINAYTLANGAWLGRPVQGIAQWFVEHRLADGGWNCEWVEGSTRSSFHSTLNSLRGILYFEKAGLANDDLTHARKGGEEYLLDRRGLYRLSTNELVDANFLTIFYPYRWFYNVLNVADYFREASAFDGTAPDPRLAEVIEVIRSKRQPDGTWLQEHLQRGRVWFDVDVAVGEPSPWLTLFGTRVLAWWDGAR